MMRRFFRFRDSQRQPVKPRLVPEEVSKEKMRKKDPEENIGLNMNHSVDMDFGDEKEEREVKKNENLANLNLEKFFLYIESKLSKKNILEDDDTRRSWGLLYYFLEKPTTHQLVMDRLTKIQQDEQLLEHCSIDDLMEIIVHYIKAAMLEEYEKRKRVWEACLKSLG